MDTIAMICKHFSKADSVISTKTNLGSLMLKAKIAEALNIHQSKVEGWVGEEHEETVVILWSTVKVNNKPLSE
ncbi:hypothetical protein H5T51_06355 [Candidatus Bathyarchaeota archaeon]|nr:hypothetical protein [Candidatus Bathyarchaeota archaeon]